jgi:hypothetical protein
VQNQKIKAANLIFSDGNFQKKLNQKEYNRLVHILDGLIDEVGENESHKQTI